ncbi:hypothetical protein [Skermanella stibiiresistens]|nr:hypothetical protein [Skermanella stibiiresistens]
MIFNGCSRLSRMATNAAKVDADKMILAHLVEIEDRWASMDTDTIEASLEDTLARLVQHFRSRRIPV